MCPAVVALTSFDADVSQRYWRKNEQAGDRCLWLRPSDRADQVQVDGAFCSVKVAVGRTAGSGSACPGR